MGQKKLVVYHTMFLYDFSNDMEVTTPRNHQFTRLLLAVQVFQ